MLSELFHTFERYHFHSYGYSIVWHHSHFFITTSLFSVHKNMEGSRIGQLSPNCHINSCYCYFWPCQCDNITKYQIWMISAVAELQQLVHSLISFTITFFSFHSTLANYTSFITLQNNISYSKLCISQTRISKWIQFHSIQFNIKTFHLKASFAANDHSSSNHFDATIDATILLPSVFEAFHHDH